MSENSPHQGSFLTGFTVGLFAGAAGFFLFGTDKGKKMTTKIAAEWEEAKVKLAEQGVIDDPQMSLKQLAVQVLEQVRDKIEEPEAAKKTPKTSKHALTTSKPKKSVKKFKNISL